MKPIDLRSDTVTRPTPAMRAAMAAAPLGDDVFGDDPTVNLLQATLAERLGFAAGLFCPTGTQSNLLALMAHCQRGDEYIVGQEAHCYKWEAGGAAVLASIQPQPLDHAADGSLPLERIAAAIKPDDFHHARTRLLALENTIGGKLLPQDYVVAATDLAHGRGLQCHLDGARFFNAVVASKLPGESLAQTERRLVVGFDSVSICLSKGLGAPVGSVLLGSADFIAQARRWRKMLGGGMRQAGVLAAAGLYALEHHVERLAQDHANARLLAELLAGVPGLQVDLGHTNMLFLQIAPEQAAAFMAHLKAHQVLVTGLYKLRLVTHLDVDEADVRRVAQVIREFF
ncbi:low-specificity L-threonine aldolase [Rhodoferax sp.]|uniref:low-specificity L-threonine aldolase n=1 Tax=Rhodoferax sp. TaxID=50421 RepID=UPI00374CFB41